MRFLPHTASDESAMLETLGISSIDELIAHVPGDLRNQAAINLPAGIGEQEVVAELSHLAARNEAAHQYASFLGGGYYRHYVPAAVRAIVARAEFATGYTPYQPEASQGTTQAIFEFQTLVAQLTGLDVANASMYDGASATAEAVLMARRIMPKRSTVLLARSLWPDYRETIRTYLGVQPEIDLLELPFDSVTGAVDFGGLERLIDNRLLCAVIGYPNFFGIIEPLDRIGQIVHEAGGLLISTTAEALSLGLLKSPGELGADIATAEGQSFGIELQFGGPGVGLMATRLAHVRQMPGRLVGETVDARGQRAYCLTLAAREQHIRRERATSNICTNHSLCALAATAYLALMGRKGLRRLAAQNVEIAHLMEARLEAAGIHRRFNGKFFNEFVVRVPNTHNVVARAEQRTIIAGLSMAADYPELNDGLLISATELNSPEEITRLCDALAGAN
ncbi:MAG TPA: aminomethyl-transferring glycine dehydrogenase subunit GcvPA [Candidatus Binataceae bacterium]|nr:aminomethyl-transferring glycine dehydrogenase subunit GcvPA [Candidatus Binataceae bacterium]